MNYYYYYVINNGEIKNAHTILNAKPEMKKTHGTPWQRQKLLKWILMKYNVLYLYGLDQWWVS